MFTALQSRDYRRFWTGALISNTGTWVHHTALGWLVYELTQSSFWLGVTSFVTLSPALALSLYGGVVADRTDRKRLLIRTQTVLMMAALALATLTGAGVVIIPHILAISFISGTAVALATPVYQTILHELVPGDTLMNAISLNSVQFNLARIIGPIVAGLTIGIVGEAGCFLFNGLSFIAMIVAVATITIGPQEMATAGSIAGDLRDGLAYAWHSPVIRTSLTLGVCLSLFGIPYIVLLPAFAREVLGLGAKEYGFLLASPGAGAVVGGLALAAFGNIRRKGVVAAISAVLFGGSIVAFALSVTPTLAAVFLFFVGLTMAGSLATLTTMLQLTAEARLRGRVMSMHAFVLFGLTPIGSLHIGIWATRVGTPYALAGGGIVCMVVAVAVLAAARHFRRPLTATGSTSSPGREPLGRNHPPAA